jgi:hypothetical protein
MVACVADLQCFGRNIDHAWDPVGNGNEMVSLACVTSFCKTILTILQLWFFFLKKAYTPARDGNHTRQKACMVCVVLVVACMHASYGNLRL